MARCLGAAGPGRWGSSNEGHLTGHLPAGPAHLGGGGGVRSAPGPGVPDRPRPGTGPGPAPHHGLLGETRCLPMPEASLHKGCRPPEARRQGRSRPTRGDPGALVSGGVWVPASSSFESETTLATVAATVSDGFGGREGMAPPPRKTYGGKAGPRRRRPGGLALPRPAEGCIAGTGVPRACRGVHTVRWGHRGFCSIQGS